MRSPQVAPLHPLPVIPRDKQGKLHRSLERVQAGENKSCYSERTMMGEVMIDWNVAEKEKTPTCSSLTSSCRCAVAIATF